MSLIRTINPDFCYNDDRGSLVQLVHEGYKQVNVITSKAGAQRGGHYHKDNDESFYVISGALRLDAYCDNESESREFYAGDFFGVGSNTSHSFTFLKDTILVSMYSHGVEHEDGTKDIFND